MTVTRTEHRPLLPLAPVVREGNRHGSRSYLTCLFKCGNACDHEVPNPNDGETIRDVIQSAVGRRAVLRGSALGTGALVVGASGLMAGAAPAAAAPAAGAPGPTTLANARFRSVAPNRRDAVVLPDQFDHDVIIRWGDPVLPGAPDFDVRNLTVAAVKKQFGYNNDYVGVVPIGKDRAVMVVNHEYDDIGLMYPQGHYSQRDLARLGMYTHGISVVTIKRGKVPGSWRRVKDLTKAPKNRRITVETRFKMTGPAAGSDWLKTSDDPTGSVVKGTLNNCAGGTTPWGTVLSGEENFNQYFNTEGTVPTGPTFGGAKDSYARYGIRSNSSDPRNWHDVDDRFDLEKEPNEPHRFGWIVEVDPLRPKSQPRKHTMLGRFKHEGANVVIADNGRAVVYSGDDERGDYIYKFVSEERYDPRKTARARNHNKRLLEAGTLYVAKFTGDGLEDGVSDGTGKWIKLCSDRESFVPGMTVEEVLTFTRLAADKVGPTQMDRPEDVEVNLVNGKVYAALTNNSQRGSTFPADEANPVTSCGTRTSPGAPLEMKSGNRNGYVLEMTPDDGDHTRSTFTWDLFLICGDPESPETYFAGFDKSKVSRISCPDNLAWDSSGNLWISTDGAAAGLGHNDGLFRVPTSGPERGRVQQFLTVPKGAECCGPLVTDDDRSLFFAPQHPGEIDGATFAEPASTWPHTDDFPRPSVCVAFRKA
ncbi:PhoX family protein [Nocardioides antri]|uniref:PhoX family phosphatase n=1 Tax=Nocardioides antri TaxID=2607659 RepID=A0A5B1LZY1_9ACTN|nr:PhoX family phosphatase [Nocardioides antri]KAA1426222.1 PhoX family phosphatase [Nocardioides antri]